MHKLYFNTGVTPKNRPYDSLMEFQLWKGGTMQIEFWVEHKPSEGAIFKFACPYNNLKESEYMEVIPIVKGGLCSEYAYFLKKEN